MTYNVFGGTLNLVQSNCSFQSDEVTAVRGGLTHNSNNLLQSGRAGRVYRRLRLELCSYCTNRCGTPLLSPVCDFLALYSAF